MENYLRKHAKAIAPCSLILETEGGGELYLGGVDEIDKQNVSRFNHIISIIQTDHLKFFNYKQLQDENQKRDVYEYDDTPFENISILFEKVTEDIHASLLAGKKVYVHCFMGRSRSASLVTAYLIRYHGMALKEALRFLRSKRAININYGFIAQLESYERSRTADTIELVQISSN